MLFYSAKVECQGHEKAWWCPESELLPLRMFLTCDSPHPSIAG
jgi:hypothetical protein